ncbi:EamA family transporter [Agrobacterium vitis]|uniref:DMT family transporter n=1 Tax=Rhizobium/Agrobacterium group TaxID=227290 RepID=UPI0008DC2C4D|nr:DMT family transporter [Agrobacterium vitis]MCF1435167.1 DMT family transporter [Allorhizobium ampelinum]MUO92027.1 EamA family transporter [Agrobacterium vitis]MUZ52997.1 EamA family transporter [Agrobacterium vitis]MUZ91216.1 EamA family transporter [Agrobacterium vitis]MVA40340.1 EamA family transporter [Agrobacterium vitis]
MTSDTTPRGLALAFAAFAAFAISDASVKLVDGRISPFESAFFGSLFGLVALPFLLKRGDSLTDVFRTSNLKLWLLRFVASGTSAIGAVTAFTHLSMAEAFCLIFLLPCFVTIMSVVFLKEQVGIRRWSAVIIGFIGVLVVLRPGFRELSIGHLGAVIGGLGGAISIVVYRAIGPREKSTSLYGAGAFGTIIISGIAMLPAFSWPQGTDWLLLLSYGLFAALATVLMMLATRFAPAAVLGPAQYSQMLWAILFGYLIFGDHVDLPMLVGITLIIGSGLITLMRERTKGVPLPPAVASGPQASLAVEEE